MIPQQFIDEVQTRTDIVGLVSGYIPLKKAGRNFKALCPFHGEKTHSFMVSPQKQIFHCFGCGEGGGVFQFLTLIEKLTFPEAVEVLAERLGLAIPYERGKSSKTKSTLYEAVNEAASFFHNNLKNNKSSHGVCDYLKERGIEDKTINKFLIGYAPANNSLLGYMRGKGFTLEVLEEASLVTPGRAGFCDLFRNRITFPIFDTRSRIIGFGARAYNQSKSSPKYINSLENPIYSKRDHLFGLNFSKDDIIKEASAIVVEGYMDMIIPFMRGVKNIVASLGTALTNEQIRLIKRYASCVILAYDSDKAGENANLRSIDLLLENGMEVKVVNLGEGLDPDSLIREKGRDYFLKTVNEANDFLEYKLNVLRKIYDINNIEGKTKIARNALDTIEKLNSEIQKYEYKKKLANRLAIKEEIVMAESKRRTPFLHSFSKKDNVVFGKEPLSITEKVILKFMLTNQKAFFLIKKNLKEEYFNSHLARKTISFFFNTYSKIENHSTGGLLGAIDDKETRGFVSKILMDDDIPLDKDVFKESLLKLRKKGSMQLKNKLRSQIEQAEASGDKKKLEELLNKYTKI